MRCRSAIWPILLIAGATLSATGCCQPGGFASCCGHPLDACTPDAQCCQRAPCGGSGGCASDVCASGGRCPLCGACRKHCGCKARDKAKLAANGPTGPALGHPRFHPVPTKPVFGPPAGTFMAVPTAPPRLNDPDGVDAEEVPAPPPTRYPTDARRRTAPKRSPVRQARTYVLPGPM